MAEVVDSSPILRPSSTTIRHFSRAKSYREDERTPLIGSRGQLLGSRHCGMPSNASAGQAWRHPAGLLYGDEREFLCSRRLEPPKEAPGQAPNQVDFLRQTQSCADSGSSRV